MVQNLRPCGSHHNHVMLFFVVARNQSQELQIKMQQDKGKVEEELRNMKEILTGERDRARDELKEIKMVADESNAMLEEAMSNGKTADVFTELNSVMESLSKSKQELKIKEKTITSLKVEVGKLREVEAKLLENDNSLENLKKELNKVKSTEAHTLGLLSQSKKRIQELEAEVQRGKESEMKLLNSYAAQTKQLEQTKLLLEKSKLEITSLHKRVEKWEKHDGDKISLQRELESLRSELQLARQNRTHAQEKHSASKTKNRLEETELLKHELKLAIVAEENSKKAMDDLVLALSEVATEASQTREKLMLTQKELEHFKTEAENFRENLNSIENKYRNLLNVATKEADRYRKTTERLRIEADESLLAWNAKETGFVDCIKRAEDEKSCALEENSKLHELLRTAENMNRISKQETQKVRDILKQALNEANVAKEAAGIARAENSQLKDVLDEKDNALVFITQENENLMINEAAALEQIKELKQLLSEASEREFNVEYKENQHKQKSESAQEKQHKDGKKPSHSCSCHQLITPHKHKDADENSRTPDKQNNNNEDEGSENSDPLRGSIFDDQEEELSTAKPEDHDHLDEPENERNSTRKRPYLRRFGDILLRRGGSNRRGQAVGGEGHRKEQSL
ncbi:PREDICTED: putative WEB family protein At1g65010, chloroplastic [Populus euphratica]|uniref:WEB family protein At1g65010, chloroplastic n=1 Tax=Populus euphratica TaxID=75702 RepID=A0AAJ6XLI1_POPEU|nr:PREDICTED: putative WEB family protein At1g65010, chloroplastic [Populus euphratica]